MYHMYSLILTLSTDVYVHMCVYPCSCAYTYLRSKKEIQRFDLIRRCFPVDNKVCVFLSRTVISSLLAAQ